MLDGCLCSVCFSFFLDWRLSDRACVAHSIRVLNCQVNMLFHLDLQRESPKRGKPTTDYDLFLVTSQSHLQIVLGKLIVSCRLLLLLPRDVCPIYLDSSPNRSFSTICLQIGW